jgi:hypothetical protein
MPIRSKWTSVSWSSLMPVSSASHALRQIKVSGRRDDQPAQLVVRLRRLSRLTQS